MMRETLSGSGVLRKVLSMFSRPKVKVAIAKRQARV
jgi:hypothetical protein